MLRGIAVRVVPGDNDSDPEQQALETAIDALSLQSGRFIFERRPFRVISRGEWQAIGSDRRYEVVPPDESRRIMRAMMAASNNSAVQIAAWKAATALLEDARFGLNENGLLLLKIVPVSSAAVARQPAMTPSQIKQMSETHWIEILVVDEDGEPVSDQQYTLRLTDGSTQEGRLDGSGRIYLSSIQPGVVEISFPKMIEFGVPDVEIGRSWNWTRTGGSIPDGLQSEGP
jgi:hypothetical protein